MSSNPFMKQLLSNRSKSLQKILRFHVAQKLGLLFLAVLLTGCGSTPSVSTSIGVLSSMTADSAAGSAPSIAIEQKNGYQTGLDTVSTKFTIENIDENNSQSDIQKTILGMAEDPKSPIIAMLGASSNLATSHAAALVNFFNVPMLVPSANGDNLFPSNNLWAFRLSAPGSAYAGYMFGSLLTKANAGSEALSQNEFPGLRVAILYEQNTFGESAAVAAAEAAMAQSIKIGLYANFPAHNLDPDTINKLMDDVKAKKIQMAFVISSDPGVAKTLVQALNASFGPASMPVIVGMAGGFASQDFLTAPEAQRVFVLRQQMFAADCPADVKSIYQAQSYASVYLLDQAITQAITELKKSPAQWFAPPTSISTQSITFREKVRDVLKETNTTLPCIGPVAFDNTGQNKLLKIELITVSKGETLTNQLDVFANSLKLRLQRDSLP